MAPDCKYYGEMMGNQRKQPIFSTQQKSNVCVENSDIRHGQK